MIDAILQIIKNVVEFLNRETSSDEKIKDSSVKAGRNYKKAICYARQIFDGKRGFSGLDTLLKDKLEKEDYEQYIKLRRKFNKYS